MVKAANGKPDLSLYALCVWPRRYSLCAPIKGHGPCHIQVTHPP